MMPVLHIRVLGPFEARLGGETAPAFESLKAKALLAYLAVEAGQPHSREAVASMLWPERPDSAALANLRHTLASLRTTLGEREIQHGEPSHPLFSVTSNSIQFNLSISAWVDLGEFERLLAKVDSGQEESHQSVTDQLSAAVRLYRGRFLEGFSLKGCPEFEDWMLLRRENAALKQQKALRSLAEVFQASGAWEKALSTLRQLLALEPWNESAHRNVMALLATHDQRIAALNQYERCRQLLWDELGVEPEEETIMLEEQIRSGNFTGTGVKVTEGKRPKELPHSHFVGRTFELNRLHNALNLALKEQGQLVFITGEAGSGKTSLAWEFAHQAMAQQGDLLVAAGRCNAITGFDDPLLPFREILQMLIGGIEAQPGRATTPELLRRLTEAFPVTIKSLLEAGPDLIGSFIPGESLMQRIETFGPKGHAWRQKFQQVLASASLSRAAASGAVIRKPNEAMTRLLTGLARHRPLVLFIDDLQWADVGSISLLLHLCKRLAGSRILILGAYRPQDIAFGRQEPGSGWERHPLEPVRLELQREFGDIELNLDRSQGLVMVNALIDNEPNLLGEDFRQTLYRHTNGNPLFTVELLRSMQENGYLVRDPSGKWGEARPFDWDKLPARVEAVIAERISRLPPDQKRLLRVASVEGENFTAEVLAGVLGLDAGQVLGWLSGPVIREQQIVNAFSTSRPSQASSGPLKRISTYRFAHILFQKYLYSQLDAVERQALHEATGLALETLYGPANEEIPLQLAWHFEQAGLFSRAAEYLLITGKQAIKLYAPRQAKTIFDRCLGLIQQIPVSPERVRLEIQVQLARGRPLFSLEGWGSPQAVQAVNRAVELLDLSGENSADPAILLGLFLQADNFIAQNNMPEALARVELLLDHVSTGGETAFKVLAYLIAGQYYLFLGQPAVAVDYLQRGLDSYSPLDQAFITGMVGYDVQPVLLTWSAIAHWLLGLTNQSEFLRQQIIEQARQLDYAFSMDLPLAIAGAYLPVLMNEPGQAMDYARECLRHQKPDNPPMGRLICKAVLGWAQVQLGDPQNGLTLIQSANEEWKTTGAMTMMPILMLLQADALSAAGQGEAALEIATEMIGLIEKSERRILEAYGLWLQGEILVRGRRQSENWEPGFSPAASFERAIEVAQQQGARSLELRAATGLACLLKEQGQPGEAASLLVPILDQFIGQAETALLREAKALLAGLSAAD